MNNHKASTIKITCHSGLCNRLRVILSGHIACQALGKKMKFIWVNNRHCGASFSDLFENKEFNITYHSFLYNFFYKHFYKEHYFGSCKNQCESASNILNIKEGCDVVRSYDYLFLSDNEFPNHSKLRKESELLFETLKPIDHIQKEVDLFVKNNFNEQIKIMGIHIRRGDFLNMSPDNTKNFELFIKEMDNFLSRNNDGKFFVATDDGATSSLGGTTEKQNILDKLIKRYGEEKILYYKPRSLNRRSKEAIQDALVSLLILRKTDEFVGNRYSSFSGAVMLNRNVPQKKV